MGQKKQVNVALDYEQYERWNEEVKGNGRYATMSDLVRMSVEKELSRDDTQGSQAGSKEIAKLSEQIEAMGQNLTALTQNVSRLQDSIGGHDPSDKHLRSEIFAALPTETPITPEEMAEKLDSPIERDVTEKVLESLSQEVGIVERNNPQFPEESPSYIKRE